MQFQLSSIVHLAEDAEKVVSLFFTYNGSTHNISFNSEAFATPESTKNTLISAVGSLVDAYIATKS